MYLKHALVQTCRLRSLVYYLFVSLCVVTSSTTSQQLLVVWLLTATSWYAYLSIICRRTVLSTRQQQANRVWVDSAPMLKVYVAQNIRAASPVANLNAGVDKAGLIYCHDRSYDCVRYRTTCETLGHMSLLLLPRPRRLCYQFGFLRLCVCVCVC